MNLSYYPILAVNWPVFASLWCTGCLILGIWIGWLLWRRSAEEAHNLEMNNRKAQKDYEKREQSFAANQELIESMLDSTPES